MDFSHMEDSVYGGDLENDAELLAELEALAGGGRAAAAPTRRPAAPPAPTTRRPAAPAHAAPLPPAARQLGAADLERALRADAPLDADDDDDAQLEEGLEDELAALIGEEAADEERPPPVPARSAPAAPPPAHAPPALPPRGASAAAPSAAQLDEAGYLRRLGAHYAKMQAEETNELKANRYKRSADKCRELEKRAAAGRPIDEAEIPVAPPGFGAGAPPVATASAPVAPVARAAPPPPAPAPEADAGGDPKMAQIKALLTRRRDLFIANAKAAVAAKDKEAATEYVAASKQFDEAIAALATVSADDIDPDEIPPSPQPYRKKVVIDNSPGKTFEEGLQKRKARFDAMAEDYKAKGDDRRYRMNARQAAQYADALKAAARGQPVDVAGLPTLPDMPPLPKQQQPAAAAAGRPRPAPGAPAAAAAGPSSVAAAATAAAAAAAARSGVDDQLAFVMERQRQFKVAALAAKNSGNLDLAKKYLTEAKGFDRMIAACKAGLNVDITKTPIPPQVTTSKATLQPHVEGESQRATTSDEPEAMLATLEKDLITQVQVAENNRLRFTRLGDVAKVRQFEEWAKAAKQDLMLVREVARRGLKVPKFHREQRQIPSADFFPDLAEDVLELSIVNAVDVPLPAGYEPEHANLFVRYTLPYPTDAPQTGKTKYAAGSRSPNWNETMVLQIGSKKARGNKLLRVLKRLPLKLEVYQKGGFLRSDKLIGTGECKLDGLETKAEVEEGAPLKEGRKATGGVVSARVRVREPLGDTKGAARTINWLVIDV